VTVGGIASRQVQHAAARFVITEADGRVLLFRPGTGRRYLVVPDPGTLLPLDPPREGRLKEGARAILGRLRVVPLPGEVEVDGHVCQRFTLANDRSVVRLRGEGCRTRIPGLADTALHQERLASDALGSGGVLRGPDDLLVRLDLRVEVQGIEREHRYRLLRVNPRPAPTEAQALGDVVGSRSSVVGCRSSVFHSDGSDARPPTDD
jgi:hypothetical protein